MLVDFSVRGFELFREEVVLNFVATEAASPERAGRSFVDEGEELTIRPTALIYGAERRSKVGLLRALESMVRLIRTGFVDVNVFYTDEETEMTITLHLDRLYTYTVRIIERRVIYERLNVYADGKPEDVLLWREDENILVPINSYLDIRRKESGGLALRAVAEAVQAEPVIGWAWKVDFLRHDDSWRNAAAGALQTGGVMVMNDLGEGEHPRLALDVVEEFEGALSNPASAQLIATTHVTSLFSAVHRDQVYVLNRDHEGNRDLYSLAEFILPEDWQQPGRLEYHYLKGRFGGLPESLRPLRAEG